jgi:peptidoglycan/LPS O-acetylase OafA/YrhL
VDARTHRFPLFDSLRAIAALSIFFFHVSFVLHLFSGRAISPWLAQLNVGVPIFFLISGFLLYRPFAQARFSREASPAPGPYALRRLFRIVPAYWVALTITALWLGKDDVFSAAGIGTYYGFFQVYRHSTVTGGIGQAWSIDTELVFYGLLPLWGLLLRRIPFRSVAAFVRSEGVLLGAMFAVGFVSKLIAIHNTRPHALTLPTVLYTLPAYLDYFAIGMGLAVASVVIAARSGEPSLVRLIDRAPWLPWAVGALAFYLLGTSFGPLGHGWGTRLMYQHYLKAIVGIGLLLPAIFGDQQRGLVRKLLANRLLLWLGLISYAFYLWHLAILDKLSDAGLPASLGGTGFTLVCFAATVAVSAASWYLLERHMIKLGHRLSRRAGGRETTPPPPVAAPRRAG